MNEEWKDVLGYDAVYKISNTGRLIYPEQYVLDKRGVKQHFKEHELCPIIKRSGYKETTFRLNGKKVNVKIHKLVALYFVPNPENKPYIDHIDGNKTNNNASNLRWVTPSENLHNPNNKKYVRYVKTKPVYKLDDNYNVIAKFDSVALAAIIMHCSMALIRNCCKKGNERYKGAGYHWKY